MPQIHELIVEVVKIIPQEQVQQRTVEQIVDVPVQQIVDNIVDVAQIIFQERVSERVVEDIVDVLVLPILKRFPARFFEEMWASSSNVFFSSRVEFECGTTRAGRCQVELEARGIFRPAGLPPHRRLLPVLCALTLTASPFIRWGEFGNLSQITK